MAADLPVIDISPLLAAAVAGSDDWSGDVAAVAAAKAVDKACRESGFFYIAGHGIPPEDMSSVFSRSRAFFALPHDAKARLKIVDGNDMGWEPAGLQKLDEGRLGEGVDGDARAAVPDLKESYMLGNRTGGGGLAAKWPPAGDMGGEGPADAFRDEMVRYHNRAQGIAEVLLKGVALAMGKLPGSFDDKAHDPITKLRLLRYPARTEAKYDGGAVGCGAHTDWGIFTVLAQDSVGGLEVCPPPKGGAASEKLGAVEGPGPGAAWVPAPPIPGALLINVGDMMKRWMNGRYRSAPHRVVEPGGGPKDARLSIAFFFDCNANALVDPREFLQPGEEPKWPPTTALQYILDRVAATYG